MCIYRELATRLCRIDYQRIHPLTHQTTSHRFLDVPIDLLTYLLTRILALFLFSFRLGSATDHRSHKPTTTSFQYSTGLS